MGIEQSQMKIRNLKRGDVLLKPGDRITSIYLIQAGRLSVNIPKDGKMVELYQVLPSQSLCEEAVFGPLSWQFSAIAMTSSRLVEIPVEVLKSQLAAAHPAASFLLKSLSEKTKAFFKEVRTLKSNREMLPCPPDNTAKVFGCLFHAAKCIGIQEDSGTIRADWNELKEFAFEVYDESPFRLEEAVNVLIKLGYVELRLNEAEDRGTILLKNMAQIEAFFDFYQNYHFKGGYSELLKTNEKSTKVTQAFLKVSEQFQMDRAGNVTMPYKPAIDAMKAELGSTFEADQLFRLEQKGLFIKRSSTNDGGILTFYRPDFEQMLLNWKVLKEVELWNEKGFVDLSGIEMQKSSEPQASSVQPQAVASDPARSERELWARRLSSWKPVSTFSAPKIRSGIPKPGERWCTICLTPVQTSDEFCPVCGVDLKPKSA